MLSYQNEEFVIGFIWDGAQTAGNVRLYMHNLIKFQTLVKIRKLINFMYSIEAYEPLEDFLAFIKDAKEWNGFYTDLDTTKSIQERQLKLNKIEKHLKEVLGYAGADS